MLFLYILFLCIVSFTNGFSSNPLQSVARITTRRSDGIMYNNEPFISSSVNQARIISLALARDSTAAALNKEPMELCEENAEIVIEEVH